MSVKARSFFIQSKSLKFLFVTYVIGGYKKFMWYVIQTIANSEVRVKELIEEFVGSDLANKCYVPMRKMKKKFQGRWNIVYEVLFPGYVFVETSDCDKLFFKCKMAVKFSKMLSDENGMPLELGLEDMKVLNHLRGIKSSNKQDKDVVEISKVFIENQEVVIVDGPLKGLEGFIKRFNLHKRVAVVGLEFFGEKREVFLGIDVIGAVEK